MKYAEKTGEDPWICLYDIIRYSTIVFYKGELPIAYINGYRNEHGDLYIHTAIEYRAIGDAELFTKACEMLREEQQTSPTVCVSTKLPERLMNKYGFEYFETTYTKQLKTPDTGGDHNG